MKRLSEYEELPGFNKTASALLLENGLAPKSQEEFFELFPDQNNPFSTFQEFLNSCEELTGTSEFVEKLGHWDKATPICVLGDFDADGISATVIMVRTLRLLGYTCLFSVPNRLLDGYGEQEKYVETLIKEKGVGLFITVDSGIAFKKVVEKIHELGAEIIITDHHLPDSDLPEGCLIIDPKYNHDKEDGICGAFVALKLAWALLKNTDVIMDDVLPVLAGIATITDIMPMIGENRQLVRLSLQKINHDKQYNRSSPLCKILYALNGRRYLTDVSAIATEELIGFYIGPSINAISRVNGDVSNLINSILSCLSTPRFFMPSFAEVNSIRQKMTNEMASLLTPEDLGGLMVSVYKQEDYQYSIRGVLGLIANKILHKYNKVSLVGTKKDETTIEFSGRSIKGYNLHEGIERIRTIHPEFQISGGGHAGAMGIRVNIRFLEEFKQALNQDINENSKPYEPVIFEFEPEFIGEIIETMSALQPFGNGFEKLTFKYRGILEKYDYDEKIATIDGINFKMFLSRDWEKLLGTEMDITFQPSFDNLNCNFAIRKE